MSNVNAAASSSKHKKDKKEKHAKHEHKEKSKKDKKHKKIIEGKHEKSPFEHQLSRMRISVAPKYSGDVMVGVKEHLDSMIMRYLPQMGGVLLAHWDHSFEDDTAKIINECPFDVIKVRFHSILWAPKIDQKLYGTHSLSSPSHLSLLFSKTFNVSIPLQHIPTDMYEFEHTDEQAPDKDSDDDEDEVVYLGSGAPPMVEQVGRWKEKETGKTLGEGGKIKFTVIGIQVSNCMLSLIGSLLPDPYNPPPAPEPAIPWSRPSPSLSPDPEPSLKKAKVQLTKQQQQTAEQRETDIDTSQMTQRELKAYRKEQEKKKREERKARKGAAGGEDGQNEMGIEASDLTEQQEAIAGTKRKAELENGEKRKKRKKDGQ
ncbi:uncharacterized protein L203_106210 [Cryptococcus depauperatus CBS 7841]|uniref:Uncharacterized protein n=1 Tax=Cryptococcus depauperatus CBS 7841 TaxID=1295531 RepID=A0A1E3IY70_9TREE|nr:hypothetical protein L203_00920 [Cryptococcus depauperatus CBS 7841]